MDQEPILQYERNDKPRSISISTNTQHFLLFSVGVLIALITNFIGNGAYTTSEINYTCFTLSSDIFIDSTIFNAFVVVIKQNIINIISVLLVASVCITVFSRSLISFILILKGFAFCRYAALLIDICNRSITVEVNGHPVLSSVIALSAAVISNILLIYLCNQARSFSEYIFNRKDDTELSLLMSPKTSAFTQSFLTVLGTVFIISLLKTFLLWIASAI